MLTVIQIADELGIDRETVTGWIVSKQLAATNVCRSAAAKKPRWRIRRSDLETFLATRSNRPAEATQQPLKRRTVLKPARPGKAWF